MVDDDPDIRDLIQRILEMMHHLSTPAADGPEAVARLESEAYDLMLLDLNMPEMGGQDVLRWLQGRPDRAAHLRVIVVSALATEQCALLRELGAHAILPKPFRVSQFRELVGDFSHAASPGSITGRTS